VKAGAGLANGDAKGGVIMTAAHLVGRWVAMVFSVSRKGLLLFLLNLI
jgi:hypothetical protein